MNLYSRESFKIGDVVKIKENADKIHSGSLYFAKDMKKYLGECFTVKEICNDEYKLECVYCERYKPNDDEYWLWAKEWLEPAPAINFDNINSSDVLELL